MTLQVTERKTANVRMLTPFPPAHLPRRALCLPSSSVFVVTVMGRAERPQELAVREKSPEGGGEEESKGHVLKCGQGPGGHQEGEGQPMWGAGKHTSLSGPRVARADFSNKAANADLYVKPPLF